MRERVVLVFAVALACVLVLAVAGLIALRLDDPRDDLTAPTQAVSSILAVLFGFVLGSVRKNGNGGGH